MQPLQVCEARKHLGRVIRVYDMFSGHEVSVKVEQHPHCPGGILLSDGAHIHWGVTSSKSERFYNLDEVLLGVDYDAA